VKKLREILGRISVEIGSDKALADYDSYSSKLINTEQLRERKVVEVNVISDDMTPMELGDPAYGARANASRIVHMAIEQDKRDLFTEEDKNHLRPALEQVEEDELFCYCYASESSFLKDKGRRIHRFRSTDLRRLWIELGVTRSDRRAETTNPQHETPKTNPGFWLWLEVAKGHEVLVTPDIAQDMYDNRPYDEMLYRVIER
jgi:hypothetical protein